MVLPEIPTAVPVPPEHEERPTRKNLKAWLEFFSAILFYLDIRIHVMRSYHEDLEEEEIRLYTSDNRGAYRGVIRPNVAYFNPFQFGGQAVLAFSIITSTDSNILNEERLELLKVIGRLQARLIHHALPSLNSSGFNLKPSLDTVYLYMQVKVTARFLFNAWETDQYGKDDLEKRVARYALASYIQMKKNPLTDPGINETDYEQAQKEDPETSKEMKRVKELLMERKRYKESVLAMRKHRRRNMTPPKKSFQVYLDDLESQLGSLLEGNEKLVFPPISEDHSYGSDGSASRDVYKNVLCLFACEHLVLNTEDRTEEDQEKLRHMRGPIAKKLQEIADFYIPKEREHRKRKEILLYRTGLALLRCGKVKRIPGLFAFLDRYNGLAGPEDVFRFHAYWDAEMIKKEWSKLYMNARFHVQRQRGPGGAHEHDSDAEKQKTEFLVTFREIRSEWVHLLFESEKVAKQGKFRQISPDDLLTFNKRRALPLDERKFFSNLMAYQESADEAENVKKAEKAVTTLIQKFVDLEKSEDE